MTTSELEQIRLTLQRIREERFPNLDAAFVDGVLDAEVASGDDNEMAVRTIRALIDVSLRQAHAG